METAERLAQALTGVPWLPDTPDWWGDPFPIVAYQGLRVTFPRPVPWDAFATAKATGIEADVVHFAVNDEGAIVPRDDGVSVEALDPIGDAVTEQLGPPFVA